MLQACKVGGGVSKVLHNQQMYQYPEEGYVGVCNCTEDGVFCLEEVLLGRLFVLLVGVLGTHQPSVQRIMDVVFRVPVMHVGNGTPVKVLQCATCTCVN